MSKPEAAKVPQLARIFSDLPLEDEELHFEFEGFARTLAELAWNGENRTPFTVVVRGGWGRGKTTLLKRAQWMLDHPEKVEGLPPQSELRTVRTLWFNAWKYPDDDTVLAGLLGKAINALKRGDKIDQLADLVASYKDSALTGLVLLAAPKPIQKMILRDQVENRYSPAAEKRAFYDTFERLFGEVSRLLFDFKLAFRGMGGLREDLLWNEETQKKEALAIFLDDLDRCREERVREVIETINLFQDLPGVCFYLGIDWDRLVGLLPKVFQEQGDAEQFLEKVVQVAFDLPEVNPHGTGSYLVHLLGQSPELARVLGAEDGASSDAIGIVSKALESRHPRHVKRFLNDLSVTLAVLRNTGKLGAEDDGAADECTAPGFLDTEFTLLQAAFWRPCSKRRRTWWGVA